MMEKHWLALASGLNDCGSRLKKLELSNLTTLDDCIRHIVKCCLTVEHLELTRY